METAEHMPVPVRPDEAFGTRDNGRTEVTLEFDHGAEPISGWLCDGTGARRRFAGWLGLAAALDAALSARVPNRVSNSADLT